MDRIGDIKLISIQQFVPSDVWKAEKFSSRKHMKDTMYDRAKASADYHMINYLHTY
jgi:hypothetical protein